jgi:hypothetical protein
VEVGAIGAEGLKRNDAAGADIFSVQQRLKGLQYGSIGGLGQHAQQCAFALEKAAQHSRDGKRPVAVRDGSENPGGKFFCKQNGAFGLAAGAKIPCATRESQEMLLATIVTANAGEAPLEPSARKELIDRTDHHGAQRSRSGLETLFASANVTVKVRLEQLIERRPFGMPRTVLQYWEAIRKVTSINKFR